MKRQGVLLFMAGLALVIGGVYVIDHIDTLLAGHQWAFKVLAGLGMGAFPLIIGVFIMVLVGIPERFRKSLP